MPSVVFAGSKVKTLKDTLTLNGKSDIISSTVDPTASAVDAPIGSLLINQTSGKLYRKLDAGSSVNWEEVGAGVGGINYILNPSAEVNTTGWATYADAAGTAPVDGTGGSPSVTWTRSTTTPLRGVADFNFAKDAANRQGQGVSYDFTIALADKAKVLSVTFDYEVLSGTYADGDLTVYLIADPAGTPVVIQPAGYTVLSATSGTTMRQRATFQTQATGTSYRLCFHVASTSASAYTLAIDNVVVGPQQTVQGAAVSDWQAKSPNGGGWTTNTTYSVTSRRVGDSAEFSYKIALSGAPNAATLLVNIPAGMTMDASKIADASNTGYIPIGYGLAYRSSVAYKFFVYYQNSTQVTVAYQSALTGASTAVNATSPVAWASGDIIDLWFTAPILGWSSNTVMSQDTDTRVVAAIVTGNPQASYTATTPIIFPTVSKDTHSSYNNSTGQYTAPISGFYRITAFANTNVAAGNLLYCYVGGVQQSPFMGTSQTGGYFSGTTTVYANAGQTIDVRASIGWSAVSGGGGVAFERLSGPATVAASETVACRFTDISGASFAGADTLFKYQTKDYDTHSAYSTTTGLYTIPVSGKYLIESFVTTASVTLTTGQALAINVYKNGSFFCELGNTKGNGSTSAYRVGGVDQINLLAGDTISFYVNTAGVATSGNTAAGQNRFSIVRVGN